MKPSFLSELNTGLSGLQLTLSEQQKEQLYQYYEQVIARNQVMNLTAITEEAEFVRKHLIDSLALVKINQLRDALDQPLKLMDVGTGAGLPGLVLKIAFPKLNVTLFDALQKRLTFLDEVIAALSLQDIVTLHGRAEDIGHMQAHRETYDLVVSRAVANLSTLAEYCLPLVKPDGYFVSYKSADADAEIDAAGPAIRILGGKLCQTESYILPDTSYGRSLLLIQKQKHTPKTYPRRAGTPSKQPLK